MIVKPGTFRLKRSLNNLVARIFSNGIDGFWYDPLLPYLTKISDGTQPVTAAEDPIGRWIDRSGRNNHAIQATAAARPTYSQRVNALSYSENFSNAAWITTVFAGTGTAPIKTPNFAAAPDGTFTACRVQASIGAGNTSGDYSVLRGTNLASLPTNTVLQSVYIKSNTGLSQTVTIGLNNAACVVTATVVWTRVNASAVNSSGALDIGVRGTFTQQSIDVLVWHPQLESVGSVSNLSPYQRSTTVTDYDTTGFIPYTKLLGTDDNLTCATGGGSTTGFYLCCAIVLTGGAGTAREIYSDSGTNTGIHVEIDAANKLSMSAGNGTAFTTLASTAALSIGTKYVLEAYISAGVMNVRINEAAVESTAAPTITAGTAGYTLFKDNLLASDFMIGNVYTLMGAKNTGLTEAERANERAYARSRIGL